jgi:hypothetical protein
MRYPSLHLVYIGLPILSFDLADVQTLHYSDRLPPISDLPHTIPEHGYEDLTAKLSPAMHRSAEYAS